jgi:flagellar hook-length control protein FliK
MGFEAALNLGLTPAAAGKSAVLDVPVNGKAMSRASHSKNAGTVCFKAALQAAAERDQTGAAGSPCSTPAPASVISDDGEAPPEADSIGCADAEGGANSAEPPAETPLANYSELGCGQWDEPVPAASPIEDPAGGAVEGGSDAAAAAAPLDTIELLDLLRRLQASLAGDSTEAAAVIRRIGERIAPDPAAPDANTETIGGNIPAQALKQLADALSAAAEESAAAGEADSAAERMAAMSGTEDPATAGQEAPGVRSAIDSAGHLPAIRRFLAQFHVADEALKNHSATTAVDGEAPAVPAERAASLSASFAATDATAGDAPALRTTMHPEAARNGVEPEPFRLAGTEVEGSEAAAKTRQEPSAESGDFRQASDDALYSKMQAAAALATGEGEASADVFTLADRGTQASPVAERVLEKAAESAPASRDKEALTGTGRAGIFDQIVQRAAVQLRNDQGEINIDLKPDFLGRVRMQILTENQQVTVRIVTELAAVRDMIETGLNQLKSELQSQGLQVERLEVAVADDHRQRGWQQAATAPAWKTAAAGAEPAMERSDIEERSAALYYRPRPGGTASIDMFV